MSDSRSNLTMCFTGAFELDVKDHAENLGVTIVTSLVGNTVDYLVAGRGYSTARVEEADALGVKIVTEDNCFAILGLQDVWTEHANRKAEQEKARKEEAERRAVIEEKEREAADAARELKRATIPHTRTTVDILTYCGDCETSRLIRGAEFENLTGDQLREAIINGQNDPRVVRDPQGHFYLICAEYRGDTSNDFNPIETEVLLYQDGTFELIEEDEEDEDIEEQESAS